MDNNNVREEQECKIVLVGDVKCGKSSLIHRVLHDKFLDVYIPTGFERYTATYDVAEQRINFTVWDTSGSPAYDTVRPLAYQDVRIFLLCFQINRPDSLANTLNKWYPEVRQHGPNVPVILCGCQSDTRQDSDSVSNQSKSKDGVALETSRQISAATYVETSSKFSSKTAREAFEVAALAALGRLNKNHALIQRDQSYDRTLERSPFERARYKSRLDLKAELRDRTKSCSIM
uniref:Uncharacterized protein n=1 Tax=Strigamia maritima TaxID=126957 RepID=T1JA46_STRMM